MIILADELRADISYPDVDPVPLFGCGLNDFPKFKPVRKEAILQHLRWQCKCLDGSIDENQLSEEFQILKEKKVIMI